MIIVLYLMAFVQTCHSLYFGLFLYMAWFGFGAKGVYLFLKIEESMILLILGVCTAAGTTLALSDS